MKNIFLTALIVTPMIANADNWSTPTGATPSGLTIASREELGIPEQLKKEEIIRSQAMEQQGYVEVENRYARYLLGLMRRAPAEIKSYRGTANVGDTHLKKTADEIKLSFDFKAIPVDSKNIIGYAPIGGYIKTPREGWTGIKTFFDGKDLGICAYEYTDLALSHGAVLMEKKSIKYYVNNKPAFVSAEGNRSSGYSYSVTWYNNIKVSRLDCATQTFQKGLTDKMMALAKKIDFTIF